MSKNSYQEIRKLWKEAHPGNTNLQNEKNTIEWWQSNGKCKEAVESKIEELKLRKKSNQNAILRAFFQKTTGVRQPQPLSNEPEPLASEPVPLIANKKPDEVNISEKIILHSFPAPAQDKIMGQLHEVEKELLGICTAKELGLQLSEQQKKRKKELTTTTVTLSKKLKRLKTQQTSSKKHRARVKSVVKKLHESHPEISKELQLLKPQPVGRPPLERDQPSLLDTILEIVTTHSSADERRRTETLRTVKTLDGLLVELRLLGFNISRSGLYIRLLPRDGSTAQGKRHVKTVPVRLLKAQNTARKNHPDTHFAAATVKYLKDFAIMFGPKSVCVISQDDKAKVPLGLPAAKKQSPILMKLEYKVQLPDHDFVIASKHKLTPSVYAALQILPNSLSYSGPTYISIRSGKHDSSTAPRHADDLYRLMELPEFSGLCNIQSRGNESVPESEPEPCRVAGGSVSHVEQRKCKPILILLVDGGPDEGPRYPKTLKYAAINFVRCNIDAMFVATHAPGQSASNPVERRMAPLSRDLCGVILPHESYGSHLDRSGKTIDEDLERLNFKKAGELLGDLWSERVIDNFPVVAEYVAPGTNVRSKLKSIDAEILGTDSTVESGSAVSIITYESSCVENISTEFLTEEWKDAHVRQSQYLLQIVKCADTKCCKAVRTNIREILKDQFLPSPVPFIKTEKGIKITRFDDSQGHFYDLTSRLTFECLLDYPLKCFDINCPSSQSKIFDEDYTCRVCKSFFVTKSALKSHKKVHSFRKKSCESSNYHQQSQSDEIVEEVIEEIVEVVSEDIVEEIVEFDGVYLIENIEQWLTPVFTEVQSEPVPFN